MTTAWFSLRRRLLGLLLGGVAAAWLATMVFSYIDAHHEVDELFDAQLAQAAQTLLALAGHDEGDDIEDLGDVAHKYQRRLRFQIWHADGKLLFEGRVQSVGREREIARVMPYLVIAMFTNYPGESGVIKMVTVEKKP